MPLQHSPDPAESSWAQDVKAEYLIFFSSRDESGKPWCPDCRAIEGLLEEAFGPAESPSAMILYVGQRSAWKTPANPYRAPPWSVQSVPTIVRTRDGARLADEEISQHLDSFIRE
ncbi:hypothetical protein OH76DRAFT_1346010 [Lentinus brumalis]|uniref:Thioredoxin domain-containing protein n=1 Tax=Lentinus brumalis TaxID=2498619 RepID=A0A371DH90_9APHY|nr:hypothetical protein OH76DRAFT_1346010 [Polyporus brumalis]